MLKDIVEATPLDGTCPPSFAYLISLSYLVSRAINRPNHPRVVPLPLAPQVSPVSHRRPWTGAVGDPLARL